jgi:diguanylate cyclase (GGDEF)-like protein
MTPKQGSTISTIGRRIAGRVLAMTLVALLVVVAIGSVATDRAATRTQRAVRLNTAYQHAASAVAAEESLERKYRLEPGPVPLAGHTAAEAELRAAMSHVQGLGDSQDRQLAAEVLREHSGYIRGAEKLFAAVDHHESTAAVNTIDTEQVDPTFGVMQSQIDAAAASHEAAALHQVAGMHRVNRLVLVFDIAGLLAGLILILAAGITVSRSRRRLQTQSNLNRHQALHDALTGLPNRELFNDRTAHALRATQRSDDQVAVLVIDLNRFKDVNDTLGHHYGDLLLSQVAERFSSAVRGEDSVARFGGDEFAVLLRVANADEAIAAAKRLTDVLHEPFVVQDITLDVEASIGIALAGPDTDVEIALRHADVAMYEAKAKHLPFATYELTRDDNTVARLGLLGDLRRAVRNGELVLHYQPKVSTGTGELHSVEALVRWQHPTRGLLAPDTFIPIAETTAVIHPLTEEVLRQALIQVKSWLDRGWRIPVAVNISTRSLLDLNLPNHVERLLTTTGVPAALLSLELTESAIMNDPGRAQTVLLALDEMGVGLSIDDFGTGYSSMAYLKTLPVRELKIDRTFVKGMATDHSDIVLVQSAVDLGHNLGLHVVAEGVEDAATQSALAAMGCDLMQGYHIRRPVSPADLEPWLAAHVSTGAPSSAQAVAQSGS